MTFFSCPKRKKSYFFFVNWKLYTCPQYTFSYVRFGQLLFLGLSNSCLNVTFICPGQSGKCLLM